MVYNNIESLAHAAGQIDLSDKAQVEILRELIRVYFDALHNPPSGVIGVGAITYAEEELVSFQLNSAGQGD